MTSRKPPDSMASIDTQSPLSTLKKRKEKKSPPFYSAYSILKIPQCVLLDVLPVELRPPPPREGDEERSQPPDQFAHETNHSQVSSQGPKILVSLALGAPAPAPSALARFNSFFNRCVGVSLSLPARDAVSELPRGVVHEQDGARFGAAGGPLPQPLYRRVGVAQTAAHAMCLLRCLTGHRPAWSAPLLSRFLLLKPDCLAV